VPCGAIGVKCSPAGSGACGDRTAPESITSIFGSVGESVRSVIFAEIGETVAGLVLLTSTWYCVSFPGSVGVTVTVIGVPMTEFS